MHHLFLRTFWFQPQLYHSWAWLSSFLMFGFYCWYTLFESTVNFLQAKQWKTELQRGMLPMEMFEIIGDWLPCSKTCNSMQLARRENKSKHKSADCILRAGGWVVVIAQLSEHWKFKAWIQFQETAHWLSTSFYCVLHHICSQLRNSKHYLYTSHSTAVMHWANIKLVSLLQ